VRKAFHTDSPVVLETSLDHLLAGSVLSEIVPTLT
jgi:hypothetical protein